MNKVNFNDLDDISKINHVNDLLANRNTLAEICIDLNIQPSALNCHFKELGYEFDVIAHKYTKSACTRHLSGNSVVFSDKELKDMYYKINEVYDWYQKQEDLSNYTSIKIDKFEGETTSRNYKVYEDIQIKFKKFCEEHKPYKVQDLVSQAFKDFIKKYE